MVVVVAVFNMVMSVRSCQVMTRPVTQFGNGSISYIDERSFFCVAKICNE